MKRAYTMPKAKMVRFSYNERITAESGGHIQGYGAALTIDRCQQSDAACRWYYYAGNAACSEVPKHDPGYDGGLS